MHLQSRFNALFKPEFTVFLAVSSLLLHGIQEPSLMQQRLKLALAEI
jgi:hypothetical protein